MVRLSHLSKISFVISILILCSPLAFADMQEQYATEPTEVIAVFPKNFPPQCFLDEHGQPAGFAIDVMDQVAKRANLKVIYKAAENWVDATQSLQNGEANLIPNSGITAKRLVASDFTLPVETFEVVIFARETTHNINSLADLKGHKVAVLPMNVGRKIVKEHKDITEVVYSEISTALFDLLSGKVDAFIYPKPVALKLAREAGIDERIKIVGEPLVEIKRAIRLRKGDKLLARLNPVVEDFIRSTDYQKIYTKWYGKPVPYWTPARVAVVMGSILFMVCIAMITWRFKSLANLNTLLKQEIIVRQQAEKNIKNHRDKLEQLTHELQNEISERQQVSQQLQNIEWLLGKTGKSFSEHDSSPPPYGDLTSLNTEGLIRNSVGTELLQDITGDFLDLLDSSSAVYEKNGDYAFGIFSSGWCRFLDTASRNLCATADNQEALASGLWLCHESCWSGAAKVAIATGQPTDIECHGGIRLYAIPITSGQKIVGAINFGYGNPPTNRKKLQEIAEKYGVQPELLLTHAEQYKTRPNYILEIAKKRLMAAARLIGSIIDRQMAEDKLQQAYVEMEQQVKDRTQELADSNRELLIEISERKKLAESFKKSEEKFRLIADFAYDWQTWISPEGELLYISPSCKRITGYDDVEFYQNSDLFQKIVHPDDLEAFQRHHTILSSPSEACEFEFRILTKAGQERIVTHICQAVFSDEGKYLGRRGSNRDTTDRKNMEKQLQRFKNTLDQAHDCVFMFSPTSLRFLYANQGAIDQVGYTQQELQQMTPLDIKPQFTENIFREMCRSLLEERQPSVRFETVHKHKDGTLIPVDVFLQHSASFGEEGRFVAIVRDISEQKKLEEKLREFGVQQETLLQEVNHRVKNNLVAIISMLHQEEDRTKEQSHDKKEKSQLQEVVSRVEGLLIVHRLLSASKWMPLHLSSFSEEIILGTVRGLSASQSIHLTIEPSDAHVNADQAHCLALVLNELATNTVKYGLKDKTTGNISVSIAHKGSDLLLSYRDNGQGFPESVLQGKLPSTSIGIKMVTGIIRKTMGGEIQLLNESGAVINILFPEYNRNYHGVLPAITSPLHNEVSNHA